jgi:adenylosuccinate lyase
MIPQSLSGDTNSNLLTIKSYRNIYIHSQRVLLALTQKGVSREDAYALVQRNAMPVWRGEGEFLTLLKADPDVSKALSAAELEALFDLGYHLKNVDMIFARVFGA